MALDTTAGDGIARMVIEKRRRVHITLPSDVADAIDQFVGSGRRGQFIAEAVEQELWRRRLLVALDEMSGSLADADIPGWDTSESAAEWVRAIRRSEPLPGRSIAIDDCSS